MSKKSLFEKVTLSNRRLNPKALALLDVLIGMAIFALIAVIAVIALGQFRQRAFQTGAVSDAKSLGVALEGAATSDGLYPNALGGATVTAATATTQLAVSGRDVFMWDTNTSSSKKIVTLTRNNYLDSYTVQAPSATSPGGFTLCVEHRQSATAAGDAYALYNSANGGVTAQSDSAACP